MSQFGIQPPPMWVGGARQFSDVAANSSSSPFGPAPGQMNTQQRLDAHYGNMVSQFDANPYAAPQVQASSAQLPGAQSSGGFSPWANNKAPQAPVGGGGGGFLSKVASLFAGLF